MRTKQFLAPTTETDLLVDILARTDALFIGLRYYFTGKALPDRACAAIEGRRWQYIHADGLPYQIGGDATARQAGVRMLSNLESAALIEPHGEAKRTSVKLTPFGELYARAIAGAYLLPSVRPVLAALVELSDSDLAYFDHHAGGPFVLEHDLARAVADYLPAGNPLVMLEYTLLPLQSAGLVTGSRDGENRMYFLTGAAGREALTRDWPQEPDDLPAMDETLSDVYTQKLGAYADERAKWRTESHVLFIPLPCSWPSHHKTKEAYASRST